MYSALQQEDWLHIQPRTSTCSRPLLCRFVMTFPIHSHIDLRRMRGFAPSPGDAANVESHSLARVTRRLQASPLTAGPFARRRVASGDAAASLLTPRTRSHQVISNSTAVGTSLSRCTLKVLALVTVTVLISYDIPAPSYDIPAPRA